MLRLAYAISPGLSVRHTSNIKVLSRLDSARVGANTISVPLSELV